MHEPNIIQNLSTFVRIGLNDVSLVICGHRFPTRGHKCGHRDGLAWHTGQMEGRKGRTGSYLHCAEAAEDKHSTLLPARPKDEHSFFQDL